MASTADAEHRAIKTILKIAILCHMWRRRRTVQGQDVMLAWRRLSWGADVRRAFVRGQMSTHH